MYNRVIALATTIESFWAEFQQAKSLHWVRFWQRNLQQAGRELVRLIGAKAAISLMADILLNGTDARNAVLFTLEELDVAEPEQTVSDVLFETLLTGVADRKLRGQHRFDHQERVAFIPLQEKQQVWPEAACGFPRTVCGN